MNAVGKNSPVMATRSIAKGKPARNRAARNIFRDVNRDAFVIPSLCNLTQSHAKAQRKQAFLCAFARDCISSVSGRIVFVVVLVVLVVLVILIVVQIVVFVEVFIVEVFIVEVLIVEVFIVEVVVVEVIVV